MHDLLEPLDDPVPFAVSADLVHAAKARGARLRRRRRLGVTGAMVPVILVLALVAGAVYVERRLDQVDRVDVAAGVLAPVSAGAPYNVLVVGTDSPSDEGTPRSDTIMVVHVDESGQGPPLQVLSIPRDLVFDGATSGADRINETLPQRGPDALIRTIHDHLGIDIAHYVAIDFRGFVKLVDAAGGISVQPATPVRDDSTGLRLDASCQHLDGTTTLALSRSRQLEYQDTNGRWQRDPTGDLGRSTRQQAVLQLVFRQLAAMPDDPPTLSALLAVFADNTTIDSTFDRATLLHLATWGHGLSLPDIAVVGTTLPVEPATLPDGAAVLRLSDDARDAVAPFTGNDTSSGATAPTIEVPAPVTTTAGVTVGGC